MPKVITFILIFAGSIAFSQIDPPDSKPDMADQTLVTTKAKVKSLKVKKQKVKKNNKSIDQNK